MRGGNPPGFQGQLISFHLRALDLFLQQETKNGTKWLQWEQENYTLTDGWWDSYVFPQGWIIKMLLSWETFNICCTLRSWINDIFSYNRTVSPWLGDSYVSKCYSENFSHTKYTSPCVENRQNYIEKQHWSPIAGRR